MVSRDVTFDGVSTRAHPLPTGLLRIYRFLPAIGLGLLLGCGDSTGPESVAGRYVLENFGGSALPVRLHETPDTILDLIAGDIRLDADGTCSTGLSWILVDAGVRTTPSERELCLWSNSGFLSVTWPERDIDKGRSTESASIVEGVLTLTDRGVPFVYRR